MIDLTLAEIAELTSGQLTGGADPQARVTGFVEFDSRKVTPGGLFVALPGEKVDGHRFATAALEQGAVAVLAARDLASPATPAIQVTPAGDSDEDVAAAVIDAMSALARAVATRLTTEHGLRIVGVTGSAGKTSTKDLMNAVFSGAGPTVAPPGSFNNEIGHPYTVLRCDEDTRYLVAELSARGIGHIAHLARIAPPSIGAVLNVGSAHLGEFGSRENIAVAKGELVEALPADGVAVLNADDPFVAAMAGRTAAKVVTYSTAVPPASGATYHASDIELDDVARASFVLHGPGFAPQPVRLQVFGSHQVSNALAAAAAGIEAGLDPAAVAACLSEHRAASAHRMDVTTRADGVTLINDSYNANPESMGAAVAALAYTTSAQPGSRAIAVLGEMGELGGDGVAAHRELGETLARFNVDVLVTVGGGELNDATASAARARGVEVAQVPDHVGAVTRVEEVLRSRPRAADVNGGRDVVLIKASNAAGLWRVAEELSDTHGN